MASEMLDVIRLFRNLSASFLAWHALRIEDPDSPVKPSVLPDPNRCSV